MEKPIRILHVLQRMEAAGVQTLLMSIYRNIDRSKVQFDFLVHYETPQFFDEEIEKLGGKVYRLSFREDYNIIKYLKDLNNFFKEHKEYTIVHGHMHSLGAIYLHYAKKWKIPTRIAHSHTNSTQNDLKKYLKLIMNKLYAKNATDLFACSKTAGKYMFGRKKFTVINNGIDPEIFKFDNDTRLKKRKELGLENKFIIGCIGRFEIQKNQKFSIEVFKEYQKINKKSVLLFIGSGSMESEIKEIVKEAKLDKKVLFLGNRRDVAELYQAMDIFLFPSLFEGLGIVGIEAQAAGLPVICNKNLPDELSVSPLLYRLNLNDDINLWVDAIINSQNNQYIHKDMHSYIQKNNYDINQISNNLEKFYLSKVK